MMESREINYRFANIPLTEEKLSSFDGTKLHCSYAKQPHQADFIFFLHGYANHTGCYEDTMTWFFNQGYHVGIFDIRGHGKSEGRIGYVDDYSTYAKDMHMVLSNQITICQPRSINIVAHSTGGLIVCHTLLSKNDGIKIDKITLCCPYIGLSSKTKPSKMKSSIAKFLNAIYPYLYASKPIKIDQTTQSEKWRKFFKSDPYHFNKTSLSWLFASESAQNLVLSKLHQWPKHASILLITSGSDVVVDSEASKNLYNQVNIINKQHQHYPNLYHQVLNEVDSEKVYERIKTYLSG